MFWCSNHTICQGFVRKLVLLTGVVGPILLLIPEEQFELSVNSSICWILFQQREFVAVSEGGGMLPCLVWQQHYSGKLDLPESLASCTDPCGWDRQALHTSARKVWFLSRLLACLTVHERWRLCLNLVPGYCLTSSALPSESGSMEAEGSSVYGAMV